MLGSLLSMCVFVAAMTGEARAFGRCREDVICRIYNNVWKGCPPTGLIDHLGAVKKQYAVCASKYYFRGAAKYFKVHPSKLFIECAYGQYDNDEGSYDICAKPKGLDLKCVGAFIEEEPGKISVRLTDSYTLRYHVIDDKEKGVTLLYTCSLYGYDEEYKDEIDMVLKVDEKADPKAIEYAKKVALEQFGVKLDCHYNKKC